MSTLEQVCDMCNEKKIINIKDITKVIDNLPMLTFNFKKNDDDDGYEKKLDICYKCAEAIKNNLVKIKFEKFM